MDSSKQLTTNEPLNVISFCAGYGGIERGLDLAGVNHRVIAYVEIEAFAIANLVAKMESGELDSAPIWSDLKTFPAHLFRDCVDIITGGYPCQPFSSAGKRGGEQDPRHLWPHIRRHIQSIRPAQCFFENVEGHISLGLNSVISDMEEDGYSATWGIFSAEEVGAPHQRKRVFILANAIGNFLWEQPRWGSGKDGQGQALTGIDGEAQSLADTSIRAGHDAEADSQCTDTNSIGSHRKEEHQRRGIQRGVELQDKQVSESRQIRKNVADTQREGQLQSQGSESTERRWSGDSGQDKTPSIMADTTGIGTQGLRPSGEQKPYAHGQAKLPMREGERPRPTAWPAEPRLGRVVDGCPDRVDRIRLLGNGVVPQTAAKAWEILNAR